VPSSSPTAPITYYPYLDIDNVVPDRTKITLDVTLSSAGTVTCLATLSPSAITVALIRRSGTDAFVSAADLSTSLDLINLSPSTNYSIFCITEDLKNHAMDRAAMLQTRVFGETLCCSAIELTDTHASIQAEGDSSVFKFMLDTLPVVDVVVSVNLSPKDCTSPVSTSTGSATASPASFTFTSSSTSLVGSFVVNGASSCYAMVLSAATAGASYDSAGADLSILYAADPTPPPLLSSATFSPDGRKIYIQFNSKGDKASSTLTNYAGVFKCGDLFTYDGASSDTCVWTSASLVTATLTYSASGANIDTGENLEVKADMLKALCTVSTCTGFVFSPRHSVSVVVPASPVTPAIALSVSPGAAVSKCTNITVNPTQTSGSGGRPWSAVSWSVDGTDSSKVLADFASYLTATDAVIPIPNDHFSPGTYTFNLQLTNFLGKSSAKSISVSVSDSEYIPSVKIGGGSLVNMYRDQTLSLFAKGSTSSCISGDPKLSYAWTIYSGSEARSGEKTLLTAIKSSAQNPTSFLLKTNKLTAGETYLVRVTVTSALGYSSYYEVTVVVGRRGVEAVLPDDFSTFEQDALTIAGTDSKDLDDSTAVLAYSWSCVQVTPTFGGSCGMLNFGTGNTLSFANGTFSTGASGRKFAFTLKVEGDGFYSDTDTVEVTFVTVPLPAISIAPRQLKYDPNSAFEIVGYVQSDYQIKGNWTSTEIDMTTAASTKLSRIFTYSPDQQNFFLGIKANTLTAGLSYAIKMSVVFVNSDLASLESFSTVDVLMNEPPSQGAFEVTPLTGVTLQTEFYLLATSWLDDIADLPLRYEFLYYSDSDESQLVVRDDIPLSDAKVFLPLGQTANAFKGTCVVFVRDIYDTPGSEEVDVTVQRITATELTNALDDILAEAQASFDPAKVSSVIASVLALLENTEIDQVDPDFCALLNRRPQKTTPATCGTCLSGYVGIEGQSNTLCQTPAAARRRLEGARELDAAPVLVTDGNKTCPGDSTVCSGQGTCVLMDFNRVPIDTCLMDDPYCRAECVCNARYTGQYCGVAMVNLTVQSDFRATLCESINSTLGTRDFDAAALESIADSIGDIFADVTLVNEATLNLCSNILFDLVRDYPADASNEATITSIATTLSALLDSPHLSVMLFEGIRNTLVLLSTSHQSTSTVGLQPFSILLPNIRFVVGLDYRSDLSEGILLPRFFAESLADGFDSLLDAFEIPHDISSGDAISNYDIWGTSLIEFLTDARGYTKGTNLIVGATDYNVVASDALVYLARVQHNKPLVFPYTPNETVTSWCLRARAPYDISIYCGNIDTSFAAECPGLEGFFNFTCPSATTLPVCTQWDGSAYSAAPQCEVVEFDEDYTSCSCHASTTSSRRLQDYAVGAQSVVEHSIEVLEIFSDEVFTFTLIPQPGSGAHDYDYVAVTVGIVIVSCCCIVGKY
jgi:hypothetical protein